MPVATTHSHYDNEATDWFARVMRRTVREVHVEVGGQAMLLRLGRSPAHHRDVYLAAWGDCCSHTWIESMTGVAALLGRRVLLIETADVWPTTDIDEDATIRYHNVRFVTDSGVCTLEFRNSSNGYYDGSLYMCGIADGDAECARLAVTMGSAMHLHSLLRSDGLPRAWRRVLDDYATPREAGASPGPTGPPPGDRTMAEDEDPPGVARAEE